MYPATMIQAYQYPIYINGGYNIVQPLISWHLLVYFLRKKGSTCYRTLIKPPQSETTIITAKMTSTFKTSFSITHITTASAILHIDGINFLTDPVFSPAGTK